MVTTKVFINEDLTALETALNTFLGTIDPKDVLDVIFSTTATGKYGMRTTHTAVVVYKA